MPVILCCVNETFYTSSRSSWSFFAGCMIIFSDNFNEFYNCWKNRFSIPHCLIIRELCQCTSVLEVTRWCSCSIVKSSLEKSSRIWLIAHLKPLPLIYNKHVFEALFCCSYDASFVNFSDFKLDTEMLNKLARDMFFHTHAWSFFGYKKC